MIKKIALFVALTIGIVATSCKKENENPTIVGASQNPSMEIKPTPLPANGKYAEMTFGNQIHDFGTITQGAKVSCIFQFKNTGGSDLLINHAKGSCGCTVPEYPKTPIAPGKSGEIKVTFNSAGKIGEQSKSVTILCNVKEGAKILYIKTNIVK